MLIDTHAHLNSHKFKNDLNKIIDSFKEDYISSTIVVGFDQETNEKALELARKYKNIYCSMGWHPVDAQKMTDKNWEYILKNIDNEKIVAVGECGLDYYWDKSNIEIQKEVFRKQIELSLKANKPLIIHTRDSINDTYEILKEYKDKNLQGVMHCFSGSYEYAEKFIELGFYISFAGPVTFKNAKTPKEIASKIDINKILIETDCPYLTPHPFRGKRNEPRFVKLVAEEIAELRGMEFEEIAEITTNNAKRLFNLKEV